MRDSLLNVLGCDFCSFYRELEVASGHVKFQNQYERVHVQLSGNCKMWRSDLVSEDGGWLSTDVYVDIIEQKWHANLKIANLFVPVKNIENFNNFLHILLRHVCCPQLIQMKPNINFFIL